MSKGNKPPKNDKKLRKLKSSFAGNKPKLAANAGAAL